MKKNNQPNQPQSQAAAFQNSASGQSVAEILPELKESMNKNREVIRAIKETNGFWIFKTTDSFLKMVKDNILHGVNEVDSAIPNGRYDEDDIYCLIGKLTFLMGIVKFPFHVDNFFSTTRRFVLEDAINYSDKLQTQLQNFSQERHKRLTTMSDVANKAVTTSVALQKINKTLLQKFEEQTSNIEKSIKMREENIFLKTEVEELKLKVSELEKKAEQQNNSEPTQTTIPGNQQRFAFDNFKNKKSQNNDISKHRHSI